MRLRMMGIALLVAFAAGTTGAQSSEARAQLESARRMEVVDGNLAAAIKNYQDIADRYERSDRVSAVEALLRLADCYRKLGDAQSTATYERIVERFPEQASAVARAKSELARTRRLPPNEPVLRRVWQGTASATPLPDGRFVSYDDNQDLVIVDQVSATSRRVTQARAASDHSAGWLSSRDGSQLVYTWYTKEKNRYDLRLVPLKGNGIPVSRVLYDSEDQNVTFPLDWSPDGRLLAVSINRKDRTRQIGLLNVADGRMTVLKSAGWSDGAARFSPDGRFIALDLPGDDVAVMRLDGSRLVRAVQHPSEDRLIGWSPEGNLLLFSSDRRGSRDLWAQPMADGVPEGTPSMLYGDIGEKSPIVITNRGSVYLRSDPTEMDVLVGAIDPATGRVAVAPSRLPARFTGSNLNPDWSPDGRYLAYVSRRGPTFIVIHDAATNEMVREFRARVGYATWLRWSPDGKTLLVSGSDEKGRIGVLTVDVATGEATPVSMPRDDFFRGFRPEWSPDGRRIYYRNPVDGSDSDVVERDLASGAERRIGRRGCARPSFVLSPDGTSMACVSKDGLAILQVPIDGGEPRELLRARVNERFSAILQWTKDGTVLLRSRRADSNQGRGELVVQSLTGDHRVTLQLDTPGINLHPDGRRFAYTERKLHREVWVLENVLSKSDLPARGGAR